MRIDPDTCREPELLAAEVRRLQGVIAAGAATLADEQVSALHFMLRHAAWACDREAFHDSVDYRKHHKEVFRLADGVRGMGLGDPDSDDRIMASDVVRWAVDAIERLRLTDEERDVLGRVADDAGYRALEWTERVVRGLLERLG